MACGKHAGVASGVGEGVAGDEGVALAWNPSSRDEDEGGASWDGDEGGASRMCFPRIRRGA